MHSAIIYTTAATLFLAVSGPAAAAGKAPAGDKSQSGRVSFLYEVHPVLSRAGCNQGTCHGNANGKGGLKLSLRGGDPQFDYYNLTGDAFGRRVNRLRPDQSLMLRKPVAALPHGGGMRFRADSPEYALLLRWIREGAKADMATAPKLTRMEVIPKERVITTLPLKQQIVVRAHFDDGTSRDVTRDAVYEPSDPAIRVSPTGLVESPPAGGEAGILIRWANRMETSRLTFAPPRPEPSFAEFPVRNVVDEAVLAKLKAIRVAPAPVTDDPTFLRRVYLDTLGILPTADEAREFLADKSPDKRDRLVDALLKRPEFDEFWAVKWADLLRAEERSLDPEGMKTFYAWLQGELRNRVPMDRFVKKLITATGDTYENPAAAYYRRTREPEELAEVTAQLFMGVRLRCAKCHNHPYDVWKQDEYYSMAAFFARVDREDKPKPRRMRYDAHEINGPEYVAVAKSGETKNPRTGEDAKPAMLGKLLVPADADAGFDRRVALADWLTDPSNPFFARAMVNRIWYHLMGRGIVEPVDDFRPSNPASIEPLIEGLTRDFVAHGFDLRRTVSVILKSSTYQLCTDTVSEGGADERNFAHMRARRLTAEQLMDALSHATGAPEKFEGYPEGTRVMQVIPTWRVDPFLRMFGQPPRETVCECERAEETTLGQSFELIGGRQIDDKLRKTDNRIGRLLEDKKSDGEIIAELYLASVSRYPTIQELRDATSYVADKKDRRRALEDVFWAVLNTKEFLMRR
jgi:hypothetical protein